MAVTTGSALPGLFLYRVAREDHDWAGPIVVDPTVRCTQTAVHSGFVACRMLSTGGIRIYDLSTLPGMLDTPQPVLPAEGSVLNTTPELRWRRVPRATSYSVELQPDAPAAPPILVEGITDTTYVFTGASSHETYRWRVWAEGTGTGSAWSAARTFDTGVLPPTAVVTLTSPADGASVPYWGTTLAWQNGNNVRLQVALDPGFTTLVRDLTLATTYYSLSNLTEHGRDYYWRVQRVNSSGSGPWSAVRSFYVGLAPAAPPVLVAPVNGALSIDLQTTFDWEAVATAEDYRIQFAHSPSFNPVVHAATVDGTQYVPEPPLEPSRLYFWRVRGDNADEEGEWSADYSFTTTGVVSDDPAPVTEVSVSPPRPNPARGRVRLDVALPSVAWVRVEVYDVLGRSVARVWDGARDAGRGSVAWDLSAVPSGLYVVRAVVRPSDGSGERTFEHRLSVVR